MKLLDEVIEKLCRGEKLPESNYDHPLTGDYEGCRECHIKFDWILVYEIMDDSIHLRGLQTGTHDEVLGK